MATRNLTATFVRPDGTAESGTLTFYPATPLVDGGTIDGSRLTVTLDGDGRINGPTGQALPASADGIPWIVEFALGAMSTRLPRAGWFVLTTASPDPVDLSTLLQLDGGPSNTPTAYTPLAAFQAHAATRGAVGTVGHVAPDGTTITAVDGVLSATGGGVDADTLIVLGDPTTMNIGTVAGVRLVVAGSPDDENDQYAAAVFGSADAAYSNGALLAYSGSGTAIYGEGAQDASTGVWGRGRGASAIGVSASNTLGGLGLYAFSDGYAAQAEGNVLIGSVRPATDGTFLLCLAPATLPTGNPPANHIYLYSDGGVLKAKADDGHVTTLAGRAS